jgi:hypothetical protein
MERIRFDRDRAIGVSLIVATGFLIVETAFPGITRPLAELFAWGGAEIIGDAGWMWLCIASIAGIVAGLRV